MKFGDVQKKIHITFRRLNERWQRWTGTVVSVLGASCRVYWPQLGKELPFPPPKHAPIVVKRVFFSAAPLLCKKTSDAIPVVQAAPLRAERLLEREADNSRSVSRAKPFHQVRSEPASLPAPSHRIAHADPPRVGCDDRVGHPSSSELHTAPCTPEPEALVIDFNSNSIQNPLLSLPKHIANMSPPTEDQHGAVGHNESDSLMYSPQFPEQPDKQHAGDVLDVVIVDFNASINDDNDAVVVPVARDSVPQIRPDVRRVVRRKHKPTTIAVFNPRSIAALEKLDVLCAHADLHKIDIVVLPETKRSDKKQAPAVTGGFMYVEELGTDKGMHGIGVLIHPRLRNTFRFSQTLFKNRMLKCEFEHFILIAVYAHTFAQTAGRDELFDQLSCEIQKTHPLQPLIVAGDFNSRPDPKKHWIQGPKSTFSGRSVSEFCRNERPCCS